MASSTTAGAGTSSAPAAHPPPRYHNSVKRTRILFDVVAAPPPSSKSRDAAAAAADADAADARRRRYRALVPPTYDADRALHTLSVKRRLRSFYPEVDLLADDGGASLEEGKGVAAGATTRVLREWKADLQAKRREEALGGGSGSSAPGAASGGGGQTLALMPSSASAGGAAGAVGSAAASAGSVLALRPSEVKEGMKTPTVSTEDDVKEGETLRPGGILVKRSNAASKIPTPKWHAPWRLSTILSSHLGWVRSVAFDPTNDMFATGGADRVIKVFDLAKACVGASDALKITLTGHVSPVRGLAFSPRHPYLFSAGEDKQVKCWDLETNQVIRHYHGHLSGVFALKLHPTLDLLVTGGRDAVARVWDMRTKHQVHCLAGHDNTVGALLTKTTDPQVITGSYDSTIKLWDLAAGKCMTTLTHHKKSVRALAQPTFENTFISGAADNLKKWQGRDGRFVKNFTGHKAVVNALALNDDGVLLSAADDGTMKFWDYGSGYCFQSTETIAQPGSLDAENGIYAADFDLTGTRLITCEADKTVKIWKQDEAASELSHPIDTAGWRKKCLSEAKQRY